MGRKTEQINQPIIGRCDNLEREAPATSRYLAQAQAAKKGERRPAGPGGEFTTITVTTAIRDGA